MAGSGKQWRMRQRSLPVLAVSLCLLLVLRSLPLQCGASELHLDPVSESGKELLPEELAELEDLDDDLELAFLKANRPDLLESGGDTLEEEEEDEEYEEEEDGEGGDAEYEGEEYEDEDEDEEEGFEGVGYEEDLALDEKDVVVLTGKNFTQFVESHSYVLVEFYAPWCGHCQSLAPHYAEAASVLKGEAALAKVDATQDDELAEKFDVQGYPTLLFFVDGVSKPYTGHRSSDEIVKWIRKKIGPAVVNVSSAAEAKTLLSEESVLVVALLEGLEGAEAEELAAAARQADGVFFGQTTDPEVAAVFQFGDGAKAPALVLLKKEKERVSVFDGNFDRSTIGDFVDQNRLPLVITFSMDTSSSIFDSDIKKQLLWFVSSEQYEKLLPHFEEAAKDFKGKIIFIHVNSSDAESSGPVQEFFGVSGDGMIIVAFQAVEGGRKFRFSGELTTESLKEFASGFLAGTLKPFLKSDPVPAVNDGDVKIVVGNNFDEIVLDETKDVLLEIYAPWCGHCQALEPIYEKLAKRLKGVDSLVIAKMDGTTNEHYRAKSDGFPTLLFFPAGNKSFDPIPVDAERTVKAFAQFLKKHAAIPFIIPKAPPKSAAPVAEELPEGAQKVAVEVDPPKDEL